MPVCMSIYNIANIEDLCEVEVNLPNYTVCWQCIDNYLVVICYSSLSMKFKFFRALGSW
jgi:hypothetical protein